MSCLSRSFILKGRLRLSGCIPFLNASNSPIISVFLNAISCTVLSLYQFGRHLSSLNVSNARSTVIDLSVILLM